MAENLKTTHYGNGNPIPNVTDDIQWYNLPNGANNTGAYCNNNNDASNATIYGRLYNWYAVTDGRKLCPTGWHVPSDAEWVTLTTFLGGEDIAGCKMKESGIVHWAAPNTSATNESGFSGLPGGFRSPQGEFGSVGSFGFWWSSSKDNDSFPLHRLLYYRIGTVTRKGAGVNYGESVRCLKD